jgi:ketosteroid isomerase-like protein
MASAETEVLAANEAFYAAFAERDASAMDGLWAASAPVACIHPGWDVLVGREEVMESWEAILDNPTAPRIRCSRPSAQVLGDTAFVVCLEEVSGSELIATNVFTREEGRWKLVHHQAGPVARRRETKPKKPARSREELN